MPGRAVLTTWEAGRYCQVSPFTIRRWVEEGKLPAYTTPGGHRRIRREDLDAFLARHGMPTPEDFSPGARRVLLLESDPTARRTARELLSSFSPELDVKAPDDPFAAGALLYSFAPHLVLFDLDDDSLDWARACESLRRSPDLAHIKTAGSTRRSTVETVAAAQQRGLLEVLQKPLDPGALRTLLKGVFPYLDLSPLAPRRRAKSSK